MTLKNITIFFFVIALISSIISIILDNILYASITNEVKIKIKDLNTYDIYNLMMTNIVILGLILFGFIISTVIGKNIFGNKGKIIRQVLTVIISIILIITSIIGMTKIVKSPLIEGFAIQTVTYNGTTYSYDDTFFINYNPNTGMLQVKNTTTFVSITVVGAPVGGAGAAAGGNTNSISSIKDDQNVQVVSGLILTSQSLSIITGILMIVGVFYK